ncbi:MAG: NlpC/P60 family protein [Actinomycetota bacterium]
MRRLVSVSFVVFFGVALAFSVSAMIASEALSASRVVHRVDNATKGRFEASGAWITSDYHSDTAYGGTYRVLKQPSSKETAARYKLKVPRRGSYVVQARWPSDPGYNPRTTFFIKTTDGWKKRVVDQRSKGGRWVGLGTHSLAGGDRWIVRVSPRSGSKGFIVADAVRILKKTSSAGDTQTDGSGEVTGSDIVREARRHIGKPYVYGADGPDSFDCSGFSKYVFSRFSITLPRTAYDQFHSGPGRKVSSPRPGDLVFGNTDGSGIDHVGIVSGDRKMVHAGTPQTDVEETSWAGWYNVVGYKRIVPAG